MKLYVVATPLGNLSDITLRALDVLTSVDVIFAEDTRRTSKLLAHFNIKKSLFTLNEHTPIEKVAFFLEKFSQNSSCALVTDAGTPGISDPGGKFIDYMYGQKNTEVVPIPGPSAVTSALSIAGFSASSFSFFGYPPKKNKRASFFKALVESHQTFVFFSTPHGILKDLYDLQKNGFNTMRRLCVIREMTKVFETIYRGTLAEILCMVHATALKGEFTVVAETQKVF